MAEPGEDRVSYLEALARAVPFHIVQAVLRDPSESAVQAQELVGTALHLRIVGVSALCARRTEAGTLESLSWVLNDLYGPLLDEAILPYEGYTIQLNGESLTAVFKGKNHEWRAAAAALTAQRLMFGEAGRLVEGQSRDLMVRAGLASGEIRLAILGELARRMVVPAGGAVHHAVHLQSNTAPNTVAASKAVVEAIGTTAEVVGRDEYSCILRGLRRFPAGRPYPALESRVRDRVEDKIALLEPFVPLILATRLRGTEPGEQVRGEVRRPVMLIVDQRGLGSSDEERSMAQNVARTLLRVFRKHSGVVCGVAPTALGQRGTVAFGLEEASDNDRERALVAALEALARVRSVVGDDSERFAVRIGLHEGSVYVGAIGNPERYQQLIVIGDGAILAVQAARSAQPMTVVATDSVLDGLEDQFVTSSRGLLSASGREAVAIHRVHAACDPEPTEATVEGAPDVRTADTEVALSTLALARQGSPQVLGICGGAGAGKSHMVQRLMRSWTEAGGACVVGRCRYVTKSVPLAPIARMFEGFFGIDGDTPSGERRSRIRKGLKLMGMDAIPELVTILQPTRRSDGTSETLLDPTDPHVHERILSSIAGWIAERARREPIMYVVEDLHLADSLTLQLAMRVTALRDEVPLVLVATYRPDDVLGDLRRAMPTELVLRGLRSRQVEELLRHTWGKRVGRDLVRLVRERSGGAPGHVLELARQVRERDMVTEEGDVIDLAPDATEEADELVPEVVRTVTRANLGRLADRERTVLEVASALGPRFELGVLEAVLANEIESDVMAECLLRLEGEAILAPCEGGFGAFAEPATRAAVYGSLALTDRIALHSLVADGVEPLVLNTRPDLEATLARHYAAAEQFDDSLMWFERAARSALRSGMYREADELAEGWRQAAKLVRPKPPAERWGRVAVLKLAAVAHRGAARHTLKLAEVIKQSWWKALEPDAQAVVSFWVGDALLRLGETEEARERLASVWTAAHQTGNNVLCCEVGRLLALSHEHAHELTEGHTWLDRAEEYVGDDPYSRVRLDLVRGNLYAEAGEAERGRDLYTRCRELAEEQGFLLLAATAITNTAYLDLVSGAFEPARVGFERAVEIDRAVGAWADEAMDLVNLGQALVWGNRLDAARIFLERGLALAISLGEKVTAAEARVHLGLAVAVTEDLERGAHLCEEGLEASQAAGLQEPVMAARLHLLRIAILRRSASAVDRHLKTIDADRVHLTSPLFRTTFAALEEEAAPLLELRL